MPDLSRLDRCRHALSKHGAGPPGVRATLAALAEVARSEDVADLYGEGALVREFEGQLAELLGHDDAAFFPSGIMAQQCAVRIWCDRSGRDAIGFHPRSHLEEDEQGAYAALHRLRAVQIGARDRVMTARDLGPVVDRLGALVLELPQRRIGGQLPPWEELQAQRAWCHDRGTALHLDGARLWEAQPHYAETNGKSLADVGGMFDSVYVSFYKGLGALAGAMLAGSKEFVDEARVWRRRHGGTIIHSFPYVLSARHALQQRLGRMAEYRAVARELAALLRGLEGIELVPDDPPANMFQVVLQCSRATLERAAIEMAEVHDVRMVATVFSSDAPRRQMFEITVGDATVSLGSERAARLVEELVDRVKRSDDVGA